MNRYVVIFISSVVTLSIAFPIESGSDSGSGEEDITLPPISSPTPSPTPSDDGDNLKKNVGWFIILGLFVFFTFILPLVRSKNLCFLGSLCNFSPLVRGICISCDDCSCYDRCSEYTPYMPQEHHHHADYCSYYCDKCCHYTATYGCMFMCFFIDIFKCPYGDSYITEKNGSVYATTPATTAYDSKYNTIANTLKKHDQSKNVFKPPPTHNSVYVQPSRIVIDD